MQNRPTFRKLPTALVAVAFLGFATFSSLHASLQDPEAVYFENISGLKPIELNVIQTTAVYANRGRSGHLKNFVKGEKVQLLAYDSQTSLVKNLKTQYTGWVPMENLSEIDESVLNAAIAHAEESKKYQAAIKEHKVLSGMTLDQVKASVGKPDEAAFRTDASGRTDIWKYFEYKSVYREQTYTDPVSRQLVVRSYKEKVPESETIIEFLNGRVTAIEKKQIR